MNRILNRIAAVGVGAILLAGCSRDTNDDLIIGPGNPASTTQLTGIFVGKNGSGMLNVTLETDHLAPALPAGSALGAPSVSDSVAPAVGVISPDVGGTIILTGTYGIEDDSLHLAGQGYAVEGLVRVNLVPPVLDGRFQGPSNAGAVRAFVGSTSSVSVFCGEFQSGSLPIAGLWNLMIVENHVDGLVVMNGDTTVVVCSGSVAGTETVRTLTFTSFGDHFSFTATGTWDRSTGHVAGTWTSAVDSGTWVGDSCLPGTTGQESRRVSPRSNAGP